MLTVNAKNFYWSLVLLQQLLAVATDEGKKGGDAKPAPIEVQISAVQRLRHLEECLIPLGAVVAAKAAGRLRADIANDKLYWGKYAAGIKEIHARFKDELSLNTLIALESGKERFYAPIGPLFGELTDLQFPSQLAYEIDEAGKCLSLGRHTAAVFHLMRIMEGCLKAISKALKIAEPTKAAAKNWDLMLRQIKAELTRRDNIAHGKGWKKKTNDKNFFHDVYVSLDAVRGPWRNATMHVERKYTGDEAEAIYAAVRIFTMKVSSRMNEEGKPRA